MIKICVNTYLRNTKIKSFLTFSLATIFIISSLSFLVQTNTIANADAITISNNPELQDLDPSTALNLVGGGGVIVVPEGTTADTPTFNPMFSECNQASKLPKDLDKAYKWEVAKYAVTAKLGDKDKLNGKDFSLDIFADIMNDDASFESKDYPYKADFKTKNDGETKVNIKEFMTLCSDIVDLHVAEKTKVDLEKSEALKELGFDS